MIGLNKSNMINAIRQAIKISLIHAKISFFNLNYLFYVSKNVICNILKIRWRLCFYDLAGQVRELTLGNVSEDQLVTVKKLGRP